MLTLYYAPGTCALASHLALEFAGADYDAVRLDFSSNQQRSPEYLCVNPKGRVPALVTDAGTLTETPALLQFIAQTHPQAGLAPLDNPFQMARVNAFNAYMCATVHVNHAHARRAYRWADDPQAQESMKKKVAQTMRESFQLIEDEMLEGPWVMGERMGICDLYLYTISRWLEGDGVDVSQFAKVADLHARLSQHDVVRRVLAAESAPA